MIGGVTVAVCILLSAVKPKPAKVHQSQRTKWSAVSSDNRHLKPVDTEMMFKAYGESAKPAVAYVVTDTPVY